MTTTTRRAAPTPTSPDFEQTTSDFQQTFARIVEHTGDATTARLAVAGDWLRAPLWLTGIASPADLQASYARLFEANRALVRAYLDALLGWQRTQTTVIERVTETVGAAVDTQAETARQVAENTRQLQQAATEVTRTAVDVLTETATGVVQAAQDVAAEAAARAAQEQERAAQETARAAQEQERQEAQRTREREQERERAARAQAAAAAEQERERDQAERARARAERTQERERTEQERLRVAARVIKGKVGRDDEKIYHLPGQSSYERTEADHIFATEDEAQAAGFRRAQTPGGGTIKGMVSRDGERIYHVPGQANYDRIEHPDMLLETEEQAQANGFRPAQR
jgi:hypothetical protein